MNTSDQSFTDQCAMLKQTKATSPKVDPRISSGENFAYDVENMEQDGSKECMSFVPRANRERESSEDLDGEERVHVPEKPDEDVPIDRGWAWVIAFSCFVIVVVFSSINQVVATLLTDILETFDVSVSVISTTFSVASLGRCVTTMLAANVLLPRLSIRVMITTASVLNALCTLAIVAFPSIVVFCAALFIKELSKGFTVISALTLVGHYFQRHRGIATALGLMGFSFCGAAVPPIIRYLKDEVGFRSSFLLYAGLEMQAIVVGLLLRPIRSYKRIQSRSTGRQAMETSTIHHKQHKNSDREVEERDLKLDHEILPNKTKEADDFELEERETLILNNDNVSLTERNQTDGGRYKTQFHQVVLENDKDPILCMKTVKNKDPTLSTKIVSSTLPQNASKSSLSSIDAQHNTSKLLTSEDDIKPSGARKKISWSLPKRCTCLNDLLQIFNPALFRSYVCLVLCTAYSVNICAVFVLMYLPTYAQSVGVSRRDSASLLTIAGIAEFCGRVFSGLLGDRKWLRPAKIISISSLSLFVTCQLAGILDTFWGLAGFSLVIGFLGCFGQNMMSLLIVDTLGLESLASVLAMGSLFGAVSFAAAHAIHGILIEVTGGFLVSFSLTGCGFLVGAVLLLGLPLVKKLQSRKEHRKAGGIDTTQEAQETEVSV